MEVGCDLKSENSFENLRTDGPRALYLCLGHRHWEGMKSLPEETTEISASSKPYSKLSSFFFF